MHSEIKGEGIDKILKWRKNIYEGVKRTKWIWHFLWDNTNKQYLLLTLPTHGYLPNPHRQTGKQREWKTRKGTEKTQETSWWHESMEIWDGNEAFAHSDRHNPPPLAVKLTKYIIQHLTFNILLSLKLSSIKTGGDWGRSCREDGQCTVCVCVLVCLCGRSVWFCLSLITVKYMNKVSRGESSAAGSHSVQLLPCVSLVSVF